MKVYTKTDVPDGEYCRNLNESDDECHKLAFVNEKRMCLQFDKLSEPGVMIVCKLPECLALPEALPCGHHPDALMDEYGDGEKWCAACAVKD